MILCTSESPISFFFLTDKILLTTNNFIFVSSKQTKEHVSKNKNTLMPVPSFDRNPGVFGVVIAPLQMGKLSPREV